MCGDHPLEHHSWESLKPETSGSQTPPCLVHRGFEKSSPGLVESMDQGSGGWSLLAPACTSTVLLLASEFFVSVLHICLHL